MRRSLLVDLDFTSFFRVGLTFEAIVSLPCLCLYVILVHSELDICNDINDPSPL